MTKRADLVGKTFGRLTVIAYHNTRDGRAYWRCLCRCGNQSVVSTTALHGKHATRSCGCLLSETTAKMGRSMRKHGEAIARTPEYRTWRHIKIRCSNPNSNIWKYYGAMGVTVCKRWDQSFEAFLADMGRKPSPSHSIDRYPDPYGNYEPGNCRWATAFEQRHNRRRK